MLDQGIKHKNSSFKLKRRTRRLYMLIFKIQTSKYLISMKQLLNKNFLENYSLDTSSWNIKNYDGSLPQSRFYDMRASPPNLTFKPLLNSSLILNMASYVLLLFYWLFSASLKSNQHVFMLNIYYINFDRSITLVTIGKTLSPHRLRYFN